MWFCPLSATLATGGGQIAVICPTPSQWLVERERQTNLLEDTPETIFIAQQGTQLQNKHLKL